MRTTTTTCTDRHTLPTFYKSIDYILIAWDRGRLPSIHPANFRYLLAAACLLRLSPHSQQMCKKLLCLPIPI